MLLCNFVLFISLATLGVNWLFYRHVYRREGETTIEALYRNHRYPDKPSFSDRLDRMDAPRGQGFHYGHMMYGWFIAPSDGEYTFFSACDDACDIYMSPDEGKDHIRRIISQRRWSGHNQWDK